MQNFLLACASLDLVGNTLKSVSQAFLELHRLCPQLVVRHLLYLGFQIVYLLDDRLYLFEKDIA